MKVLDIFSGVMWQWIIFCVCALAVIGTIAWAVWAWKCFEREMDEADGGDWDWWL